MHARYRTWVLVCCVSIAGCGGDGPQPESAAAGDGAPKPVANIIAADALAGCAGFTAAKAASLLGVPPEEITDYSRDEGRSRMCHYRKPDDPKKAVSFTLSHRASVEQATASIQRERESMGAAQGAINQVTGSSSKTAATEDVSGIGDDAFYSAMNGTIMLRVRNVIAQVMSPADMALKKRAAQEIAEGLRR